MNKYIAVIVLIGFVALAEAGRLRREGDKYTTKYDNVDIEGILQSDRLLQNYFNCLVSRGKCTPDASELKAHLKEALQENCSKCSEKQKTESKKVIQHLIKNKEAMWKELEALYDPTGKYRTAHKDEFAA